MKLKFKPFPLVSQCEEIHPTGSHFCRLKSPSSSLWALQPSHHWPASTDSIFKFSISLFLQMRFACLFRNHHPSFIIHSCDNMLNKWWCAVLFSRAWKYTAQIIKGIHNCFRVAPNQWHFWVLTQCCVNGTDNRWKKETII